MSPAAEPLAEAVALHRSGKTAEAEASYRAVLRDNPRDAEALAMLGALYMQRGDMDEALRLIAQSLELDPRQPLAHNNRGVALQFLGRHSEALESFSSAIASGADTAEVYYNRGSVLHALKRYNEALADYDRALARRPAYPYACNNRGNALRELKRDAEALESYDRAIAFKPDFADAHNNRGNALRSLKRPEEALAGYTRTIKLKPDFAAAHYNHGIALQDLDRNDQALAAFERAIALKPDYADAQWSIGTVKLLTGDFKTGWPLYEWRWKRDDYLAPRRDFRQPLWRGDYDLKGKTIFLYAEQGFGDTIHFCRYAKLVAALGAKVILEVQPALKSLMTSLAGVKHVIAQGETIPSLDYHCPLLSLPLAFKTELDTIPADIPYLKPAADRIAHWAAKLGERHAPRVGLVWAGNPQQKNDQNRSMLLLDLMPLLAVNAEFFSLQKDLCAADKVLLATLPQIKNIGEDFTDFADAAAAIAQMDVVITVCTSVAHLAGAMGKPVWLLLCHAPCWRWLRDRDDSPWYPTARLFRQPKPGDWASAVDEVRGALTSLPEQKP